MRKDRGKGKILAILWGATDVHQNVAKEFSGKPKGTKMVNKEVEYRGANRRKRQKPSGYLK